MPKPTFRIAVASWPALIVPAAIAFAWALLASSDLLVMRLNWDTANYVAKYASATAGWSDPPWNSHFAIGPIYWIGYWLVAPLGGSFIDGARLMNAVSLSVAASFVALAGARLAGRAWLGALVACVYVFSWGISILLLTIEDNVLYLPWVTAVLCLCLARIENWRARDSVLAGVLLGAGVLVSWQAGLYLFPVLYVACLLGGSQRDWRRRARDAGLIVCAFVATLFAWVVFFAATSDLGVGSLASTLMSRPEPSFFPESWRDVRILLTGPRRVFRHLGTGLMQEVGPVMTESRAVGGVVPELGLGFFLALLATTALATWRAWKKRTWSVQLLLMVFTVLTIVTSFYVDLPTDKYKRYEYVPLFGSLIVAALVGAVVNAPKRRLPAPAAAAPARILAAVLGLIALVQLALGVTWARDYRADLPRRSPPEYFGVGHQPWFVYLRELRAATPDRCRYVFAFSEFVHGRYQLEIPAALWAELPGHVVIGDPEAIAEWRHAITIRAPQDVHPVACDWISPAARALLAR